MFGVCMCWGWDRCGRVATHTPGIAEHVERRSWSGVGVGIGGGGGGGGGGERNAEDERGGRG